MKQWLGYPSVQIALCAGICALIGWRFGALALLGVLPLAAVLIAWPIYALGSNLYRKANARIWRPVHGRHYAYRDISIQVEEDEEHFRWLQLADVQKIVGVTASEHILAIAYPNCLQAMGEPATTHIRDDALIAHLDKMGTQPTLRFRTWIERNIAHQGQRLRTRYGIRPVAGDAKSD